MRREDRKVIAGVCSGLAYRLGVDANVVRIVAIVLTLFGGAGVLLYVLGWLLMTDERTSRSLAERAVRGGGAGPILLAVALTLVAVGFALVVVGDNWFGVTVLVVAVGIGALLLTRQPSPAPLPGGSPIGASSPGVVEAAPPQAAWRPTPPPPAAPPAMFQPAASHPPMIGTEPDVQRPRAVLGPVTAFSAVAALGVLAAVDAATAADVPVAAYLAVPLAVVGMGLVIGAWFGRSRGLIALGAALTLLLVPVAAIEQLVTSDSGAAAFEPVVLVERQPDDVDGAVLEYSAGDIRWDMSGVDFTGTSAEARVDVGAGTLVVEIPDAVTLVLDATVGAGEIDALGDTGSGFGVEIRRTFEGADSAGGTLNLDVEMGMGTVEVDRAQA